MCSRWEETVLRLTCSSAAISGLDRPWPSRTSTSASRAVSPDGRPARRRTRWPAALSTARTPPPPPPVAGRLEHRLPRLPVEPPGAHLAAHHPLGIAGLKRRAVRARLT